MILPEKVDATLIRPMTERLKAEVKGMKDEAQGEESKQLG